MGKIIHYRVSHLFMKVWETNALSFGKLHGRVPLNPSFINLEVKNTLVDIRFVKFHPSDHGKMYTQKSVR